MKQKVFYLIAFLSVTATVGVGMFFHAKAGWQTYVSQKLNISFDTPKGWSVLYDSGEEKSTTILCPPENRRLATKVLYANCIEFLSEEDIFSIHPWFGPTAVFSSFPSYLSTSSSRTYQNFRITAGENLTALYRDGNKMLGLHQSLCAPGEDAECQRIFSHVFKSVRFLENVRPI